MKDYINIGLIFSAVGIYVCYALYGLAQERLCVRPHADVGSARRAKTHRRAAG